MEKTEELLVLEKEITITNCVNKIDNSTTKLEIINGLKSTPKFISPKYFYDTYGSKLFEEITNLDEYYPTRTEKSILSSIFNNLNLDTKNLNIIELGSGDPSKIRLILKQIPDDKLEQIKYSPIDISRYAIEDSCKHLATEFPALKIHGIVADFMLQLNEIPVEGNRLFCFFGSTLGNLTYIQQIEFLRHLSDAMYSEDSLIIGLDMIKDISVIEKAYNDNLGVTSKFNKNILNVVNNIIDSNFNTNKFEHYAFFNQKEQRIEMHLRALEDISVNIDSDNTIYIKKGETIHTENSYKFDTNRINTLGKISGLNIKNVFNDENKLFSIVQYTKP